MILLFSGSTQGQNIPKKANTIIITDELTKDQFYDQITDILLEAGYGIHSTDRAQGTITTIERPFKDGQVRLTLLIKDNRVVLRGSFSSDVIDYGDEWEMIVNRGQKGSIYQNAWLEFKKIADQISGTKEYLII